MRSIINFSDDISFSLSFGTILQEENTRQLEEQAADAKRLASINNLSTFGDYAASTFGEQLPNLVPSVVGGLVGSVFGPAGTVGGIKIGTMIGAGLANLLRDSWRACRTSGGAELAWASLMARS